MPQYTADFSTALAHRVHPPEEVLSGSILTVNIRDLSELLPYAYDLQLSLDSKAYRCALDVHPRLPLEKISRLRGGTYSEFARFMGELRYATTPALANQVQWLLYAAFRGERLRRRGSIYSYPPEARVVPPDHPTDWRSRVEVTLERTATDAGAPQWLTEFLRGPPSFRQATLTIEYTPPEKS